MIDVSDAFDGFLETVQLERPTAGHYDNDGNWIDGTATTEDIQAVVQSLNSDELLVLSEGDRTKATIKVHTKIELRSSNEETSTKSDKIIYQGYKWNVSIVNNRDSLGGYFKAILVRQLEG